MIAEKLEEVLSKSFEGIVLNEKPITDKKASGFCLIRKLNDNEKNTVKFDEIVKKDIESAPIFLKKNKKPKLIKIAYNKTQDTLILFIHCQAGYQFTTEKLQQKFELYKISELGFQINTPTYGKFLKDKDYCIINYEEAIDWKKNIEYSKNSIMKCIDEAEENEVPKSEQSKIIFGLIEELSKKMKDLQVQ